MLETWLLTVFSPTKRSREICLFALPKARSFKTSVSRSVGALGGAHLAHEPGRRLGGKLHLAVGGGLDRSPKLAGLGVLEQVSDSTRPHRIAHRSVLQDAGERYDLYVGHLSSDCLRGLYAVHHRHKQIHQHHVGPELARHRERLLAVFGLANHLEPLPQRLVGVVDGLTYDKPKST